MLAFASLCVERNSTIFSHMLNAFVHNSSNTCFPLGTSVKYKKVGESRINLHFHPCTFTCVGGFGGVAAGEKSWIDIQRKKRKREKKEKRRVSEIYGSGGRMPFTLHRRRRSRGLLRIMYRTGERKNLVCIMEKYWGNQR